MIRDALLVAVALLRRECETGRQVIRDRYINRAGEIVAIEAAGCHLDLALEDVAGLACDDADRPADRIATEQGALRPFQNLDALDIQKVLVRADRPRVIDAIDINADAWVEVEGEIVLADAADRRREHGIRSGKRRSLVKVDVRREIAQRMNIPDAFVLQSLGCEGRDRDRHLLDVLGPLFRRHDHRFEAAHCLLRKSRTTRVDVQEKRNGRRRKQQPHVLAVYGHFLPLSAGSGLIFSGQTKACGFVCFLYRPFENYMSPPQRLLSRHGADDRVQLLRREWTEHWKIWIIAIRFRGARLDKIQVRERKRCCNHMVFQAFFSTAKRLGR